MNHPIQVDAPSGRYYLLFKHLRGSFTYTPPSRDPVYTCGSAQYTIQEAIELLSESLQPLPKPLLKGHRLATAAYISDNPEGTEFMVGIVPLFTHGTPTNPVRRLAMTRAISSLSSVDRAYFHLTLSALEGRDMLPILASALVRRSGPDRGLLLDHLLSSDKYRHLLTSYPYLLERVHT